MNRLMLSVVALVGAAALVAGCGDGQAGAAGRPVAVDVVTGADLGLTQADRVIPGMSVGVWTAVVDGDVAVISERHLLGDEAGAGYRLTLDLGAQPPQVVEVIRTRDGEGTQPDERLDPGTLTLQDADPTGTISGEYRPEAGNPFRFWADATADTYVEDPDLGNEFQLRPGGVVDMFSFALQYVELLEDSRCPVDVQCVWEGRVVVKMRFVSEGEADEFELRGFSTPDGPIFGDQPTWATPVEFASTEFALVGLDGDTITLVRRQAGD